MRGKRKNVHSREAFQMFSKSNWLSIFIIDSFSFYFIFCYFVLFYPGKTTNVISIIYIHHKYGV
jgi:hypothetical protein